MEYVSISTYQFIMYCDNAVHKHTHARILKPFEDGKPTEIKVDIALKKKDIICRNLP